MMRIELPEIRPAGRYNTAQAAALLGVDRHTLARWTKEGHVKAAASNARRRYYRGVDLMQAYRTH